MNFVIKTSVNKKEEIDKHIAEAVFTCFGDSAR